MAVLITGGAGFIGFHVGLKLVEDKDNEVVVLDIFDGSYDLELKNARAAILKKAGNSEKPVNHLLKLSEPFTALFHISFRGHCTLW